MAYTTYQPNPEDFDECTLATCPQDAAIIKYLPSLAGNATYLAIFAILLLVHTGLGIRYRTWGFLVGTSCCFILEIIGYSGRIILHSDPFPLSNFLMYFTTVALAPAFLNGSIYLVLGRYIIATSTAASRLKPRTYTITFISADLTSLVLQAIGGALTSVAEDNAGRTQGTHILIAGLVMQVLSMAAFLGLWVDFAIRLRKVPEKKQNVMFTDIRQGWRWKGFQPAIFLSMMFIFIRCVYRAIELNEGFEGKLANDEVTFMVLEGPMIMIAAVLVAVWHPGFAFGEMWGQSAWRWNGKDDGMVPSEKLENDSSSEV